jgi:dipeptidyl aminopeptidase/acylaminoacyl peptidase
MTLTLSAARDACAKPDGARGLHRSVMVGGLAAAFGIATAAMAGAGVTESTPVASIHIYVGLVLSPDGTQVAAVESDGGSAAPHGVVMRSAADGTVTATFDPCNTCSYADPAWSPDSKSLAFVGWDPTARKSWIWVAQGKALNPASNFDGLLAKPRYSPDGKTLAVLATEHPSQEADPSSPLPQQVGDVGALPPDVRRIAVVEASPLKLRLVSPADRYVYEYDWAPDGKAFAVTDAVGNSDSEWYVARLELVDLATGAARTLAAPKLQMNYPLVSPDGKSVVFIGGLMSDYGEVGGDIWTVPIAGGQPRNITPEFKGSFNSLQRRAGKLYATAVLFDRYAVLGMETDGSLKSLWSNQSTIRAGDARVSLSADASQMATTQQSFTIAPRIVAGRISDLHPITHDNDSLVANMDTRSISYTNEGLTIHGWLLAPKNLRPGKTYPMAVYVHGGPAKFQEARFHLDDDWHDLVDHGFFVFVPNVRGSFGQGETFTRANVMDLGGGDLRDILAGVDAVEKIAPVDEGRLAIFGHSYGGFMVAWAVTQTNRFKAAVASTTQAQWFNDDTTAGVSRWQDPYFLGMTPYEHLDVFDRISPIRFVKRVKTPTFIYNGASDLEAPPVQAIEFWNALKAMGVPTSLVLYPGEGHKFSNPANERDVTDRTVAWFEKYVGGGAR